MHSTSRTSLWTKANASFLRFDTAEPPNNTIASSLPLPTLSIPTGKPRPQASASTGLTSSSKQKKIGTVVGGLLGGLVLLVGLFILFLFLRWRRTRHDPSKAFSDSNRPTAVPDSIEEAVGNANVPALPYSEKRVRLRMEEIQRRIEALRLRIAHLNATGGNASNTSPEVLGDPQVKEQPNELRAQISALQIQQQRELDIITQ